MAERRCLTELELERWLADDLPAARREAASDADRARLEALRTEHAAWLAGVDVPAELAAIEQRVARALPAVRPPVRRWRTWAVSGGALAAAAVALLILVRRPGPVLDDPGRPGRGSVGSTVTDDDDPRIKGGRVALVVHVATPSGSRPLASGDTVRPGDRIRFEVHVPKQGYVAIIGIDGTGGATVYYPFGGNAPAPIGPKSAGILPGAVALDAAPGDERVHVLYAPWSFALDDHLLTGIVPAGVEKAEVLLHKNSSP